MNDVSYSNSDFKSVFENRKREKSSKLTMSNMQSLQLNSTTRRPLLEPSKQTHAGEAPNALSAKHTHTHPKGSSKDEDASIYFIGTATTILEWQGIRIMTDPNFLHAGDHVHLGPGVTAQRRTNPAVDLHELPPLDCILLSHYHADHFDQLVEESLNRAFPIVTTPHAKECLTSKSKEPFTAVWDLDFFESLMLDIEGEGHSQGSAKRPFVKVTGMPGKHVPPGPLATANELLKAVPPTNGWLLELGYSSGSTATTETGYRIYISGDTLFVDELKEIPKRLQNDKIDLMLVHLGGTTIPGPSMPLVMVTMDATQGLKLMQLMNPDVTIPIHFDDYDVFLSPLSDFKDQVDKQGWNDRVVYLDRGEQYRFKVRDGKE